MKKESILTLVVVLAFITTIVSVGKISSGINFLDVEESLVDSSSKVETIHFLHWTNFPKKIISNFSRKYSNVKVEFERVNITLYPEAQKIRLASGENIDIMGVLENDYSRFVNNGYLLELTEKNFLDNYSTESINQLKNMKSQGIYCIPYKSWVIGVWYNKSLFSKYNISIPDNINSFLEACKRLKSYGVTPIMLGCRDDSTSSYLHYLSIFNAGGEDLEWSNKLAVGEVSWTDKRILNSSQYTERIVKYGYLPEETINLTYQQAFSEFLRGRSAMCISADWSVELCEPNSDKFIDLGVFALPYNDEGVKRRVPGYKAGFLTGVFSGSKNITSAELFLQYISEPNVASIYSDETGTHTNVIGSYGEQKYDMIWESIRRKEFITPISIYLDSTNNMSLNKSVKELIVDEKPIAQILNKLESMR